MDQKLEALGQRIETSIETHTQSSHRRLIQSLSESPLLRAPCQATLETSLAIDRSLRIEVVPKLDTIVQLLTTPSSQDTQGAVNDQTSGMSRTGAVLSADQMLMRGFTPSPTPTLTTVPSDHGPIDQPGQGQDLLMDKVLRIEDRVKSIYKVVVDGEIPSVPGEMAAFREEGAGGLINNGPEDTIAQSRAFGGDHGLNAFSQLEAMQDEMLSFPETLAQTGFKMEELLEELRQGSLAEHLASSARTLLDPTRGQSPQRTIEEVEEQWREVLGGMHGQQMERLGVIDTKMDASDHLNRVGMRALFAFIRVVFSQTGQIKDRLENVDRVLSVRALGRADHDILEALPSTLTSVQNDLQLILASIRPGATRTLSSNDGARALDDQEEIAAHSSEPEEAFAAAAVTGPENQTPRMLSIDGLANVIYGLQDKIDSMNEKYQALLAQLPSVTFSSLEESAVPSQRETLQERRNREARERQQRVEANASAAADTATVATQTISDDFDIEPLSRGGFPMEGIDAEEVEEEEEGEAFEDDQDDHDSNPPPSQLLEELLENSRLFGQMMTHAATTLNELSTGQTKLCETISSEIQRVVEAIHPPETEEDRARRQAAEEQARIDRVRQELDQVEEEKQQALEAERMAIENEKRAQEEAELAMIAEQAAQKEAKERTVALDRISIIPDLVTSLETIESQLRDNVERTITTMSTNLDILLRGSYQDSSALCQVMAHLESLVGPKGSPSSVAIQELITEAIRTATDVYNLVSDIKSIEEGALEQQGAIQALVDESCIKLTEQLEALQKSQESHWEAWNTRAEDEQGETNAWRSRVDIEGQESRLWRQQHAEMTEQWHKQIDERLGTILSNLGNSAQCASCSTATVEEINAARHIGEDAATETASREMAGEGAGIEGGNEEAVRTGQDSITINVDGSDPSREWARRLEQQFLRILRDAVPGYDSSHAETGLSRTGAAMTVDREDQASMSGSSTMRRRGLRTMSTGRPQSLAPTNEVIDHSESQSTVESYRATLTRFPSSTQSLATSFGREGSLAEGASSDYVSARASLSSDSFRSSAPIGAAHGADVSGEGAAGMEAETNENAGQDDEVASQSRQDQHQGVLSELARLEDQNGALVASILGKNREIQELVNAKIELEEQLQNEKERSARRKIRIQKARAKIEQLYRGGLGLPLEATVNLGSSNDDGYDDNDNNVQEDDHSQTTDPNTTPEPRHCLYTDAADQLRLSLDAYKDQAHVLKQEIDELLTLKSSLQKEIYATQSPYPGAHHHLGQDDDDDEEIETTLPGAPEFGQATRVMPTEAGLNSDDDEAYEDAEDGPDTAEAATDSKSGSRTPLPHGLVSGMGSGWYSGAGRARSMMGSGVNRPATAASFVSSASSGIGPGGLGRVYARQARRASYGRSQSTGPRRARRRDTEFGARVPQMEAVIRINRDGERSEELLKSTTVLTEEQFERVRLARNTEPSSQHQGEGGMGQDESVWSLSCDFNVRMVTLA
ncbi:hypothetical protein BGW38_004082 [Lunasporangiospora selenospora]|uniref:Uncharacterized protein n=1 Tax=Lunasporangiospora selenospora TaxID=979761 RepID=A0A9P6FQK5_9FUNG|nr:hypothetical protein BGW38_004082 [Lunasporangiospora selenospora]